MKSPTGAIMEGMIRGYGSGFGFTTVEGLMEASIVTPGDITRLMEPFPARGRYRKDTDFLKRVTSSYALGRKRYRLFAEKLIFLAKIMKDYQGKYSDKKIIPGLSPEDEQKLLQLGDNINYDILAELLENVADNDTAAYADAFKILIYVNLPHLAPFIEAVHNADTSEDNWGNVVGLTLSELVFGHTISAYINFCEKLLDYVERHQDTMIWESTELLTNADNIFILPIFTHWQSSTSSSHAKGVVTSLKQIINLLYELNDGQTFKPFSGKFGGITGTYDAHFAQYPDIDWFARGKEYIESLGLHYESMVYQSVAYTREAQIFRTLCTINEQIIKFVNDFRFLVSCPGQLFIKKLKPGGKGSSSNPGKTNLWMCEGGVKLLKKANVLLNFVSTELQDFTQAGDMGRSVLMRDIGADFSNIFIALNRILKELNSCVPNPRNIKRVFEEYPSLCMSAMQYVLKREHYQGDSYRAMQQILINKDGSYATRAEFMPKFEDFMEGAGFTSELREELRSHMDPVKLVRPIHERAVKEMGELRIRLSELRRIQSQTSSLKHYFKAIF